MSCWLRWSMRLVCVPRATGENDVWRQTCDVWHHTCRRSHTFSHVTHSQSSKKTLSTLQDGSYEEFNRKKKGNEGTDRRKHEEQMKEASVLFWSRPLQSTTDSPLSCCDAELAVVSGLTGHCHNKQILPHLSRPQGGERSSSRRRNHWTGIQLKWHYSLCLGLITSHYFCLYDTWIFVWFRLI